jgi:AsmA-like C-terminal region
MTNAQEQNVANNSRRWKWIGAITLALLVVLAITVKVLISRAEPILRARVIETLSTRFHSRVELKGFHVWLANGLEVSGEGLEIYGQTDPNIHEPGIQSLIGIDEFHFRIPLLSLLRSPMHVQMVRLKGLVLNIPPAGERQQMGNMGPKGGKIKIFVDEFISEGAELIINTSRPDKLPLEFDIGTLKMKDIGPGQPMHFDATLVNPKPIGDISSSGFFGPWQADGPRDSPVQGTYSFSNADLGTIKGIGGILSSTGQYGGTLGNIVVDGTTETPDFHLAVSGHPVPLHTEFHAIVDGTSGDTYLEPVKAKVLHSSFIAKGSIVRVKDPKGHHIVLDVLIDNARIEDLLKLGVRTDPPIMTGAVRSKTKLELIPGDPDIVERLTLKGNFEVSAAHFTKEKIQSKLDALSLRSQGEPKLAKEGVHDDVESDLNGVFILKTGVLSFSQLQFKVPGTQVDLTGEYSMDGNKFDFHGKARLDAKLSHMVTGWKALVLKPVDPFFSKNGATEIPVKVTGTESEPHFGLDLRHKDDGKK